MSTEPDSLVTACYDHLSGIAGDRLTRRLVELGWVTPEPAPGVTPLGWKELSDLGIPMAQVMSGGRKPVAFCHGHLGGHLGALIRQHFRRQGWLIAEHGQLRFSVEGERVLNQLGVNLEVL